VELTLTLFGLIIMFQDNFVAILHRAFSLIITSITNQAVSTILGVRENG
jgi:hypothetical protein